MAVNTLREIMPLTLVALSMMSILSPPQERVSTLLTDELIRCLAEQSDAIRLTCLERTARTVIATEKAQATAGPYKSPSRRSVQSAGSPRLDRLESAVVSIAEANEPGRFVFTAKDGSRWRTEESGLSAPPRLGQHLVVKQAALRSYRVTFEGERPVQVRRLTP